MHAMPIPLSSRPAIGLALLLSLLSWLALPDPARAGSMYTVEIRGVITDQIDALQRDDARAAFECTTPSIRATFGTPERFMNMVRRDYKPIFRNRSAEFLDVERRPGGFVQPMRITTLSGRILIALFLVSPQPDERWLIEGVIMYRAPETSA